MVAMILYIAAALYYRVYRVSLFVRFGSSSDGPFAC